MIHSATKKKLLAELEKNGNVCITCMKVGVNRATYYRWRQESKEFLKRSNQAVKHGRENNSDIAEHALMIKVKAQDLTAIKYVLGHNSPRYKNNKSSNVVIVHKKEGAIVDTPAITLEDIFDDYNINGKDRADEVKKYLTSDGKEIPNKLDGTPIEDHELHSYKAYIADWQNLEEKKILEKRRTEFKKQHMKSDITSESADAAN